MKLLPSCLALTALFLAAVAFGDEKRGPSIESPKLLQMPAADPEMMIKQIDLKVVLEQYEKLMAERLQTQVQLDLFQADADSLSADTEQKKLEQDIEAAGNEKERQLAADRLKERQARVRGKLKTKIVILVDSCEAMRLQAIQLATDLEKLRLRTNHYGTDAPAK